MSQKFYKKAALFVLRAIAKHSPELALIVVQNEGMYIIIECLEDFDPGVKEAAAWALGYIARHKKNLAQAALDAGKKFESFSINIFCFNYFQRFAVRDRIPFIIFFSLHFYNTFDCVVYQAQCSSSYCVCKSPSCTLNKSLHRLLAT